MFIAVYFTCGKCLPGLIIFMEAIFAVSSRGDGSFSLFLFKYFCNGIVGSAAIFGPNFKITEAVIFGFLDQPRNRLN